MNVSSIIKNKIFIYLATRYLTYGLQFVLSLIVAVRLGPYYLGVYGVVTLILSYFSQINFGIPHSLNVYLVHNKTESELKSQYSLNSYVLYTYLSIIIIVGASILWSLGYTQWGNYDLSNYYLMIVLISILSYYNTLITTIIRFNNQVNTLSLIGSIPVISNLLVVFVFRDEALVVALTAANLASCIVTIGIGYKKGAIPTIRRLYFNLNIQKNLLHKGIYLFLYNSCFYFILIVIRTIISSNYSVEEFGYFTFSYTVANAVMLILDSLNTIIFPKTIDILSSQSPENKDTILEMLRIGYITSSHLLIYIAMIFFPVIVLLFPNYKPALSSMNMIALTILINTNSYGYNTLLIAQNQEKTCSIISFIALFISIVLGMFIVHVFNARYSYVIFAMLIAYLVFSFLATFYGKKLIKGKVNILEIMKGYFPLKLLLPYSIAIILSILEYEQWLFLPLLVFIILNIRDLQYLKTIALKLIKKPDLIDVK